VFTQMITAHDMVFSEMLEYLGVDGPILDVVEAGHEHVKSQVDNYRTYVAGGNKHVISLGYFDSIPQTGNRTGVYPISTTAFTATRSTDGGIGTGSPTW